MKSAASFKAVAASVLLAALALGAGLARADLGGADITGPAGDTTTGRKYEARCGAEKEKCTVGFKDEKLMVDDKGGIYRDQFINVVLKKECTQRSLVLPWVTSCFENQLDWAFTLTYKNEAGDRRSALITFMPRYFATGATDRAREFERDLQIWVEGVLRPIGPSIQVEGPKPVPASRRPQPKETVKVCSKPVSDFGCSWGKYLDANPNVRAWSQANPVAAEKEKLRLGAVD
jgi:hypothetical protein